MKKFDGMCWAILLGLVVAAGCFLAAHMMPVKAAEWTAGGTIILICSMCVLIVYTAPFDPVDVEDDGTATDVANTSITTEKKVDTKPSKEDLTKPPLLDDWIWNADPTAQADCTVENVDSTVKQERRFILQGDSHIIQAAHDPTFCGKATIKEVLEGDKIGESNLHVWVQADAKNLDTEAAKAADLIICSSPELLPDWAKAKHVFPDHTGTVRVLPIIHSWKSGAGWIFDVPAICVQALSCGCQHVSRETAIMHLFFGNGFSPRQ